MSINFTKTKNCFKTFEKIKSKPILAPTLALNPKLTIAIPTFNRAKLLREAIEVLVVDDNPERDSETEKLILTYKSSKIRYYKNDLNIGMFGNWNRCIELALGEYITILNDDDLLDGKFLNHVMQTALKTDKLIFTGAYKIDSFPYTIEQKDNKLKDYLLQDIDISNFVIGNQSYGSLGIVYKTKKMLDLGGFDKSFFPSADYIFNARYVFKYGGLKLMKKLSYYRILENESIKESNLEYWPILDAKIKEEICSYAFPSKNKKSILLYASINQKKYLKNQWGANVKFNEKEIFFMKTKYKLFTYKAKIRFLFQIFKGTIIAKL